MTTPFALIGIAVLALIAVVVGEARAVRMRRRVAEVGRLRMPPPVARVSIRR